MEQVGSVDEEAVRRGQRVLRLGGGHASPSYASGGPPATIGPCPSCCSSTSTASSIAARTPSPASRPSWPLVPPRGDDVVYVTNNSMHYRADYVTAPRRDGRAGRARPGRLVVAGDRAPPPGARARASGACWPSAPAASSASCATWASTSSTPAAAATRMAQEAIDGLAAAGSARRGRRRPRPEPDLPAARRGRRLHPGRRPLHRHEPRPGLSRPSAASGPAPGRSSPPSRPRPASTPLSIGKPAPLLLEVAAEAVGREPARRS